MLPRNQPWPQVNPLWAAQLDPVISNPIINGRQVGPIMLVANTPQTVNHGLGRLPQGFITVLQSAIGGIAQTAYNASTVTLEANATMTFAMWVY